MFLNESKSLQKKIILIDQEKKKEANIIGASVSNQLLPIFKLSVLDH